LYPDGYNRTPENRETNGPKKIPNLSGKQLKALKREEPAFASLFDPIAPSKHGSSMQQGFASVAQVQPSGVDQEGGRG